MYTVNYRPWRKYTPGEGVEQTNVNLLYLIPIPTALNTMTLPPVFYHVFRLPLPYSPALQLQERVHQAQLALRRANANKDILLLLQHRPVYTAGRRQTASSVQCDFQRLTRMGADFVLSSRGGQLTYHGPGQIVGYPLIDLSRYTPAMGARDYVCRMQKMIEQHLEDNHGLTLTSSEHTGVFLDPVTKIASIGVQIRHRLTSHGFAFNVTQEPLSWFDQIVACGLNNVKAGSIESSAKFKISMDDELEKVIGSFGRAYGREMVLLEPHKEGEIGEAISAIEMEASLGGSWPKKPMED
jgi:lipoyl(octanoyl) transferase